MSVWPFALCQRSLQIVSTQPRRPLIGMASKSPKAPGPTAPKPSSCAKYLKAAALPVGLHHTRFERFTDTLPIPPSGRAAACPEANPRPFHLNRGVVQGCPGQPVVSRAASDWPTRLPALLGRWTVPFPNSHQLADPLPVSSTHRKRPAVVLADRFPACPASLCHVSFRSEP